MSIGARAHRPPHDFEEDPRYRVSTREAWIVVAYWVLFTVVLTAIAWGLGGNRTAEEITFVLGIPAWFFWSGIVASIVLSIVPIFLVRALFTDVPLAEDPEVPPDDGPRSGAPSTQPDGERG